MSVWWILAICVVTVFVVLGVEHLYARGVCKRYTEKAIRLKRYDEICSSAQQREKS